MGKAYVQEVVRRFAMRSVPSLPIEPRQVQRWFVHRVG
ncbi:MAG: hypothetical protein AVDCRST_MAG88-2318 [uncultured Thermomicrobiales bacterium]|uniref:Uncharacterized protein n=1 Tax=uncultured Thermomicrobiales bacterium TaxID=1645740 RepID=A0A6J4V7G8_9BACT|nr:MAG: hypothetical protein AVDCRST_MAG88-2318 [uncultured Thermomicrobiales bacterium]